MNQANIDALSLTIMMFVMGDKALFPMSSESLTPFLGRMAGVKATEAEAIEALRQCGFEPQTAGGQPWSEGQTAWFRLRFVRDEATRGLFSYTESAAGDAKLVARVAANARNHPDRRMREFCRGVMMSHAVCRCGLTDGDMGDYLRWLARHSPSSKSAYAAALLYHLSPNKAEAEAQLSPEQMQFVRENPRLKPSTL